jgi:Zn finger protein HypA/HybF involved in hydrogenase expression
MDNTPIEPQDYIGGVSVVDIGDVRVARGLSRRAVTSCRHRKVNYDQKERRIWCQDCEHEVSAFDAFVLLVEEHSSAWAKIRKRERELAEAEAFQVRGRAAKRMDEAWRRRNMAPACPHCHRGILAEDVLRGLSSVGVEFELARRAPKAP